jgi:hypothetical protein
MPTDMSLPDPCVVGYVHESVICGHVALYMVQIYIFCAIYFEMWHWRRLVVHFMEQNYQFCSIFHSMWR